MKFNNLIKGKFIRRYKRFLLDVVLENDEIVVAHTSNTGSMLSCIEDNAPVLLSKSDNPKRKTKYTWEMIFINDNWIGINTLHPNALVEKWLINNELSSIFPKYNLVKREFKFLDSRLDIYAENETEKCLIEVKNVTYRKNNQALFPDAKSTRGQKHLKTLMKAKELGYRAVMIYVIQRIDVESFAPAINIDSDYAALFEEAHKKDVEIIPVRVKVSPEKIVFDSILPFNLTPEYE